MEQFITIYTFSYPHEAAIIQGRLESEGIETFLKDELTVQTYHFYSNALGGIKLQVRESDVAIALEILKDAGYVLEEEGHVPWWWQKLESFRNSVPMFGGRHTALDLWAMAIVALLVMGGIIYLIIKPSTEDILTKNNWCMEYIIYQNTEYSPRTVFEQPKFILSFDSRCTEPMEFYKSGELKLPGFNTEHIGGTWYVERGDLIFRTTEYQNVYQGRFKVEESGDRLILVSDSTVIYCFRERDPFKWR